MKSLRVLCLFSWVLRFPRIRSDLEVDGGVALGVDAELIVLAGQDGVEQDATMEATARPERETMTIWMAPA